MIIEYKKPYWVKYLWGIETSVESYHLKTDNFELQNILFEDEFSFICNFRIDESFIKDTKAGIFGKPGQNFGLNFDSEIDSLVFEFRTNTESPEFHCLKFNQINSKMINDGVNLIITKRKNKFMFFLNHKLISYYTYDGDFIDEYRNSPFFLGALNPGAADPKDRCYSQVDIELFAIIKNESNLNILKSIDMKNKNVLCYYDFKKMNVRKDVYDESNNFNFIELVPKEFVSC